MISALCFPPHRHRGHLSRPHVPYAGTPARTAPSTVSSTATAPALSSGSLPFPHFGDWTQDGHPAGHSQEAIASRVAASHGTKAA